MMPLIDRFAAPLNSTYILTLSMAALFAVAFLGCTGERECTTDSHCPDDHECASTGGYFSSSGVCLPLSPPDAGDSPPSDDTGPPDFGSDTGDAGDECSQICGDLNGDGTAGSADVELLQAIVDGETTPSECDLQNGDITGTGEIDLRDVAALDGIIAGTVSDGCQSCDRQCGDVTGNGDISTSDTTMVLQIMNDELIPTACQFWAADINGDGVIDERDQHLLLGRFLGTIADEGCAVCDRQCGDVNGDGQVDISDASALQDLMEGDSLPTVCEFTVADIKVDGTLDRADINALGWLIQNGTTGGCETTCYRDCGDISDSGDVGFEDSNRLQSHLDGTQPLLDVCDRWAADVTGDGQLTNDDLEALGNAISQDDDDLLQCAD